MRRSEFVGRPFLFAVFLTVAACQPVATKTAPGGIPLREATGSAPQPAASAARTPTLPAEIPSMTRTPAPNPSEVSSTGSVSATPTLCSASGRLGIDGRAISASALPASASIAGIRGREQSLPLDCESRSAVDWAEYFGTKIDELEFFHRLPVSENPDEGFVGSVRGKWGNLPPNAYGIYAGPVAYLLRDYGVDAYAYRGVTWDDLRAEIAAGRPVVVWVVGHVARSTPVTMTVTGGPEILAARYEHTVILVGYDEKHAAVLDGSVRYAVPYEAFLTSWGTLGDMAIVARMLPARPDCAGTVVELIP